MDKTLPLAESCGFNRTSVAYNPKKVFTVPYQGGDLGEHGTNVCVSFPVFTRSADPACFPNVHTDEFSSHMIEYSSADKRHRPLHRVRDHNTD